MDNKFKKGDYAFLVRYLQSTEKGCCLVQVRRLRIMFIFWDEFAIIENSLEIIALKDLRTDFEVRSETEMKLHQFVSKYPNWEYQGKENDKV